MSDPVAVPDVDATALCPQCGALIEVKDVRQLILALHLVNECELSTLISGTQA